MSIKIIDAHTHVNMMDAAQQSAVIQRALSMGIGMINAGADEKTSVDAVALTHAYVEGVWATVGCHPQEIDTQIDLELIKKLAQDERVVGIGECGLEYFKLDPVREVEIKKKQKELFEAHIQIAHEVKKPLVIHCREAFADTISILKKNKEKLLSATHLRPAVVGTLVGEQGYGGQAGIIHFFTGTPEDAKQLLELGFSFTFGGLITFNRSFDEIIKSIPVERILVETDAPWVAPQSHRGQQNEPSYIPEVVTRLAQVKSVSQEEMEGILLENTKKVFAI